MSKRGKRRRWVAHIGTPRIEWRDEGLSEDGRWRSISIDHPAEFHEERQPDSTHVLVCPKCGAQRYVDRRFVESIEEMKRMTVDTPITVIGARHKQCQAVLEIQALE